MAKKRKFRCPFCGYLDTIKKGSRQWSFVMAQSGRKDTKKGNRES